MGDSVRSGDGRTEVLDQLLAGETPAHEISLALKLLPADDRQAVLCSACAMQVELATTCSARADDVNRLLNSECHFYMDGRRTCS